MKARVKETGATFQVLGVVSNTADGYALDEVDLYCDESDNLVVGVSEDYWEKLKHQYAGMAMQGFISASRGFNVEEDVYNIPYYSELIATALVEKLKESKV